MTKPETLEKLVKHYALTGPLAEIVKNIAEELEDCRCRLSALEIPVVTRKKLDPHPKATAQKIGDLVVSQLVQTAEATTLKYPQSEISSEPDGLES